MQRDFKLLKEYTAKIICEANEHDAFDYIMQYVNQVISKIEVLLKAEYTSVDVEYGDISNQALGGDGYYRRQDILLFADNKRVALLYVGMNLNVDGNVRYHSPQDHSQYASYMMSQSTFHIRFGGKARSFNIQFVKDALAKNPKNFTEFINLLVYSKVKKHSEEKIASTTRDIFTAVAQRFKGAKLKENYILNNTEYPIVVLHKQFMIVPVLRKKQFGLTMKDDIKTYAIFISRKYIGTAYANNVNTGKYKLIKLDKLKTYARVAKDVDEFTILCSKFAVKNDV